MDSQDGGWRTLSRDLRERSTRRHHERIHPAGAERSTQGSGGGLGHSRLVTLRGSSRCVHCHHCAHLSAQRLASRMRCTSMRRACHLIRMSCSAERPSFGRQITGRSAMICRRLLSQTGRNQNDRRPAHLSVLDLNLGLASATLMFSETASLPLSLLENPKFCCMHGTTYSSCRSSIAKPVL
jgi:hypothetical protein